jgi:hypothetical protein
MRKLWRFGSGKIARPHARSNFRKPERSERRIPPAMEFDDAEHANGRSTTATNTHPHEDGDSGR